jgi:hypothetical protein
MRVVLSLFVIWILIAACKRNAGTTATSSTPDSTVASATTTPPTSQPAAQERPAPGSLKMTFDHKAKYTVLDTLKSKAADDYAGYYNSPETYGQTTLALSCSTETDKGNSYITIYDASLDRAYKEPNMETFAYDNNTIVAGLAYVQNGKAILPQEPPTASGLVEAHTIVFVTLAQDGKRYRGVWLQHVPKGMEPENSKDPWRLFVCEAALSGTGGNPCK